MKKLLATSLLPAIALLSGCGGMNVAHPNLGAAPVVQPATPMRDRLKALPLPAQAVPIAVYAFADQTGQFKPSDGQQQLSRAVSQGGASVLVKALTDTGNAGWFRVAERESLRDILTERQLIGEMRRRYGDVKGGGVKDGDGLPPMMFAGIVLEGGITGYDASTRTGGFGARFLGIGGSTKYRQDTITVHLRAVSVQTGEVLASVETTKTVASYGIDGGAFRYVGFQKLLEIEGGVTANEPAQMALRQAIEKAVYALVLEGIDKKLWSFKDQAAGWPALWRYRQERDGATPTPPDKIAR